MKHWSQDKNLIDALLKSGIDYETKFNKQGQIALDQRFNQEYHNYLTLTDKLADQLKRNLLQYTDPAAATEVTANTTAELGVADLTTLGNFLNYTVRNGIKVNGQRVAYAIGEKVPDPKKWWPVSAEEATTMMESEDAEGNRQASKADFYVNKELLTAYINSLVAKVSKEDESVQRFAKTMLQGIIQKVNQMFDTKLTTEYKEPEKPGVADQKGKGAPAKEPGSNAGPNMSEDVIARLTALRPFNSQYVNFAEITDFVDTYAQFANNAEVNQTANTIKKAIRDFKSLLAVPRDTLQLFNLTTDQFKAWLKNGNAATVAINVLYDIIEYAGALYQQLVVEMQTIAANSKNIDYRSMQQQVVPGGPQTTNISTINTLKYNLELKMKAGH